MPVEQLPQDVITQDNLLLGLPIVEVAPVVNQVQQPFISLGIIQTTELAKTVENLALSNFHTGTEVTARELVSKIEAQLNIGIAKFDAQNLQWLLASQSLTPITADATAAVVNELRVTSQDPLDFLDLANRNINDAGRVVTAAAVVDEIVGIGDGTSGSVQGDFTLRNKVFAVADVTSVTVTDANGNVTTYTAIADAAAVSGNEVEVIIGTAGTSGDLQFFVGGVAVNVTGTIRATYTPSFALTEGLPGGTDDYLFDRKLGRLQVHHEATKAAGTQPIIAGQGVHVDYTYDRKARSDLKPLTQGTFTVVARIRHLPSVGINFIWDIPSASIQINDDSLTFQTGEPTVGTLVLNVLDAGGADRFGTLQVFSETQANL